MSDDPLKKALAALRPQDAAPSGTGARAEWVVIHGNLLFACAVVDRGRLGTAYLWVIDLRGQEVIEERSLPIALRGTYGVSAMTGPGVVAYAQVVGTTLRLRWLDDVGLDLVVRWPRLDVTLTMLGDRAPTPSAVPAADGTPASQLLPLLRVKGTIRASARVVDLSGGLGAVHYVTSRTEPPGTRRALGMGRDTTGCPVAFSLTSTPTASAQAPASNALWTDEVLQPLTAATIRLDPRDGRRPFAVVTDDNAIDLTFTPRLGRDSSLKPPLIAHIAGYFNGTVRAHGSGERLRLVDVPGLCALHD